MENIAHNRDFTMNGFVNHVSWGYEGGSGANVGMPVVVVDRQVRKLEEARDVARELEFLVSKHDVKVGHQKTEDSVQRDLEDVGAKGAKTTEVLFDGADIKGVNARAHIHVVDQEGALD